MTGFPRMDDWNLYDVHLQDLNLIVGKNSVGKSRALSILSSFADTVTQNEKVYTGEWKFSFINREQQEVRYFVSIGVYNIVEEKLLIDDQVMLERSAESASLYSQTKKDFETITPPDDKLVFHSRRDKREYPFLEEIVEWAQHTHSFYFGQINPKAFLFVDARGRQIMTVEDIPSIVDQLGSMAMEKIIQDFNTLGYNIEKFYSKLKGEKDFLYIKEKGLKHELKQDFISQGMFRALTLIVFIHYLIDQNKAQTIIIDDLCEGLDYARATQLGKLIFETLKAHNIQLIASSNDSFLMDVVNIRYWNVFKRNGSTVNVYNYINSKEKFDDFKYSGLSNFDLFASDYLY